MTSMLKLYLLVPLAPLAGVRAARRSASASAPAAPSASVVTLGRPASRRSSSTVSQVPCPEQSSGHTRRPQPAPVYPSKHSHYS